MGESVHRGHGGIGYGTFAALSVDEQARLLAYVRVKADPEGKHRRLSPAEGLRRLTGGR